MASERINVELTSYERELNQLEEEQQEEQSEEELVRQYVAASKALNYKPGEQVLITRAAKSHEHG